jgi:S13-like protein
VAGGTSNPAPGRTLDQRLRALREANEIRVARAQLKKELASGRVRIEEILAEPPRAAMTAKVYDLLVALPRIGPVKAARSLIQCRIASSKTVGGLTERQRHELIDLFRR